MQLQDLTRQILIEAAVAIDAGDRSRTDRGSVVEIEQHRGVALGRQQHVGKAAEHVWADRLALIGAGHHRRIEADAEMVRPEPHQPLDQSDFGVERGVKTRPCFLEKDLARQRHRLWLGRLVLTGNRRRGDGFVRHHGGGIGIVDAGLGGPLAFLLQFLLCQPLGVAFVDRAIFSAARRQIGIGDLSRTGRLQVGQHRSKRIGCDRRDRAGLGTKAETVKGERRPFWIKGHDD
jgi:hypothetical protein